MRVEVKNNRIEGFCNIPGWIGEQSVIVFSTIQGKWHTASSMCIPAKLDQAEVVMNCYIKAYEELKKKLDNRLDS